MTAWRVVHDGMASRVHARQGDEYSKVYDTIGIVTVRLA
jgi:hypothetical protein